MKASIAKLVPAFNTHRMVREYAERFYVPAIQLAETMMSDELSRAKSLAAWKQKVRDAWPSVGVKVVTVKSPDEVQVGDVVVVEALVHLGALVPDDVAVELYYGPTSGGHELAEGEIVRMRLEGAGDGGAFKFSGEIPTATSGAHAFRRASCPTTRR